MPSAVYTAALVAARLVGFRMEVPWAYYQLLDAEWLRAYPATSLLYMHSQPPGLNALLALVMAAADLVRLAPEAVAAAVFVVAGWIGVLATFALARRLTASVWWAVATVAALLASPGYHLFQHLFFYPFLIHVLLVNLLWTVWRYLEGGVRYLYATAIVLATICLTWVLYHPVWALGTFAVVVLARLRLTAAPGETAASRSSEGGLARLRHAALPGLLLLVLLLSWPLKNYALFGRFIYTSWTGSNLANTTGIDDNWEFTTFMRRGRVSPSMQQRLEELTSGYSEPVRSILLSPTKSDGSRNHNHLVVLLTDRDLTRRALAFRLANPRFSLSKLVGQYWAWTRATFVQPYTEEIRGPESPLYRAWAGAVLAVAFPDLRPIIERLAPLPILHEQAFVRRRELPYTLFGALIFPLTMLGALIFGLRDARRGEPGGWVVAVAWLATFWSMLVPAATFGSEGNRMRFATAAVFLLLAAYVLQRLLELGSRQGRGSAARLLARRARDR